MLLSSRKRRHLRETLQLMCSQRRCARLKLEPLATHLLMHPGKTAGRAINTALTTVSAVFVLGHDLRCDGRSRRRFHSRVLLLKSLLGLSSASS